VSLRADVAGKKLKPLLVEPEKYTVGLLYRDSLNADGYFYIITPSRKPSLKLTFPLEKAAFRESRLKAAKTLVYADPSGQVFYVLVFSEHGEKGKYPATVAKIYRSDGLAWSNHYELMFIPSAIEFKPENSEVLLKDAAGQVMAIDKNGKLLR
jgi:hypothetical protein